MTPGPRPDGLVEVNTARVTYAGPDRFDVTRKSGGPEGAVFAPSWSILRPVLDARSADPEGAWRAYVPRYLGEMRASYRANRAAWDALLARPGVTLVCYCTDPYQCHRTLLARDILPRLGASYRGER